MSKRHSAPTLAGTIAKQINPLDPGGIAVDVVYGFDQPTEGSVPLLGPIKQANWDEALIEEAARRLPNGWDVNGPKGRKGMRDDLRLILKQGYKNPEEIVTILKNNELDRLGKKPPGWANPLKVDESLPGPPIEQYPGTFPTAVPPSAQPRKTDPGFPVALPPSPVPPVETRPFPVGIAPAGDVPQGPPEDPTPSAPAQAPARKQSDAGDADPGLAAFRARVAAPVADRGLAALLKPESRITEGEYRALIDAAATRKPGDPLRHALYDKSWAVAGHVYGDGPQTFDGGKPVEPRPVNPFPDTETPVDLSGMARVARAVEGAAATDGLPEAVRHLQRGVNLVNPKAPLKEDGVYGPVTDFATKRLVAAKGPEAAENAVALGRFNIFARAARRDGKPDGLDRATQAAFGPLLPQGATAHAEVLQETLNRRGAERLDDWTDLRVDGRVGQKTTAAFGRLLAEDDPDDLTRDLGRGMGIA